MKSMRKILLLLTMVLACSLIPAAAIAAPAPVPAASTAKTGIEQTKLTLYVGNTWQLYVYGTTKKVTWKSSKPSVAKVNSKGLITAKKAGTATITAKVGSKSYKCKVTVKKVRPTRTRPSPRAAQPLPTASIRRPLRPMSCRLAYTAISPTWPDSSLRSSSMSRMPIGLTATDSIPSLPVPSSTGPMPSPAEIIC